MRPEAVVSTLATEAGWRGCLPFRSTSGCSASIPCTQILTSSAATLFLFSISVTAAGTCCAWASREKHAQSKTKPMRIQPSQANAAKKAAIIGIPLKNETAHE